MHSEPKPTLSYLLRMWPAQSAGQWVWRASLENPHTGEKLFFASLSLLSQFLLNREADSPAVPAQVAGRPGPAEDA